MPERDLTEMMHDYVTVSPWASVDPKGQPTYGAGASYLCRVENAMNLMRGEDAQEGVEYAVIYFADKVTIDKRSRLTLPNGSVQPIVSVNLESDDEGSYATVVYTFSKRGI